MPSAPARATTYADQLGLAVAGVVQYDGGRRDVGMLGQPGLDLAGLDPVARGS